MKLKDLMKQAQNTLKAINRKTELTPYEKELCRKFAEVQGMINELWCYDEDIDGYDKFEDIDIDDLEKIEKDLLKKMQEVYEETHLK